MKQRKQNIVERGAYNAIVVVYAILGLVPILLVIIVVENGYWPPPDWVIEFSCFFPVSFGWEPTRNDVLFALACWLLAPTLPLLVVLTFVLGYIKTGFYETARCFLFMFGVLCLGLLGWEFFGMISKL